MAESGLEDLLQEALADFEELKPIATECNVGGEASSALELQAPPQPPAGTGQAPHEAIPVPSQSTKVPPKGLGLGRGLGAADPLARRPRKPTTAATPAEPTTDASSSGVEAPSVAVGDDASAGNARKLPAKAQRLADDLMSLLQEAGLAGGEGPGGSQPDADELTACLANLMGAGPAGPGPSAAGSAPDAGEPAGHTAVAGAGGGADADAEDPFAQLFGRILGGMMPPGAAPGADAGGEGVGPPPELAAMLQQMMGGSGLGAGGMGAAAAGMPGPSGPGGAAAASGDEDDALASSRLAGLAQQTRKTVSKQAKKTRGHVEGAASARAAAASAAGGGLGGLFGGGGAGAGGMGGLGAVLRELGSLGGAGAGGDEDSGPGVNMMVDYVMRNLLSKDVLYGPLKEIRDRYPPWLEANQGKLPAEDYQRYVAQYESVQRVCAHYETAPSDFAKLMDLIQEMQTYGDPPGDIVEEMTGGAGRDLNSLLASDAAEETGPPSGTQPALEELAGDLDKCKMQ